MIQVKRNKTYTDYQKLPEGAPVQLINGDFVESPSPTVDHQHVIKVLFYSVYDLERQGKGKVFFAPLDVYLAESETYQPDVIFISEARSKIIGEKKIEGAPDIVMEILSPSTAYYDLRHKKYIYCKSGVKEYWIIDPIERVIEVYENKDRQFMLSGQARHNGKVTSLLYPELQFDCGKIFGFPV